MRAVWASGDAYEPYVGRWSRAVAAEFVAGLGVGSSRRWLDVGCGTGALSSAILRHCEPAEVVGIDPSEGYVAWAATHVDDPRARFEVADATQLPDGPFDVVVSGLVLNFVPNPAAAVTAMRAAVAPGTVAAYVWDDEGVRFPICRPERLEALWRQAGLAEVSSRAIDVPTTFRDFDDYWSPFLGGQGPAPGYAMSLGEGRRAALREGIRSRLPIADDGSITLTARAWAVRGRAGSDAPTST